MPVITHATSRRQQCINALDRDIRSAVRDGVQLEREEGFDGQPDFWFVPDTTLPVEVDGDALLGYYADREPYVTGYLGNRNWEAKVKTAKRTGRSVTLTVDVKEF